MTAFRTSAAGLAELKRDEGAIDGLYDDPSGYATFGVGHLVHPAEKWGSFLLAAARASPAWKAKLSTELGVSVLPRSATGWVDFAALRSAAIDAGVAIVAARKFRGSLETLTPAQRASAKAIAEGAVRLECMLLSSTVDSVLADDIVRFERAVNARVTPGILDQHEFDALVSIAFNIGAANFASSTLLRRINENKHLSGDVASRERAIKGIAEAFGMWRKSGGVILPGLVKRRASEADRFLKRARQVRDAVRQPQPPSFSPAPPGRRGLP